jgi:hypothetical protein
MGAGPVGIMARKKSTIRTGEDHPEYKTGAYSQGSKKEYWEVKARLRALENLAHSFGVIEKPRRKSL